MLLVSFLIKMKVRSQQCQCKCLQDPMAVLSKRRNHTHVILNWPCTGGLAISTPLWSYEMASQMLFRGYVTLGKSSPGIVRQL